MVNSTSCRGGGVGGGGGGGNTGALKGCQMEIVSAAGHTMKISGRRQNKCYNVRDRRQAVNCIVSFHNFLSSRNVFKAVTL